MKRFDWLRGKKNEKKYKHVWHCDAYRMGFLSFKRGEKIQTGAVEVIR